MVGITGNWSACERCHAEYFSILTNNVYVKFDAEQFERLIFQLCYQHWQLQSPEYVYDLSKYVMHIYAKLSVINGRV